MLLLSVIKENKENFHCIKSTKSTMQHFRQYTFKTY